ncbi:uncharacterized protein F13E9.13, mitochondrial [Cylas formicarius]|uniref:uncharacterized protein F13E9.13, mitochondrial n=1 Tax=Cylas formicarius TaxID=197179 RepID=UPI00295882B0|nr:uncharacterized protein F13E9.13, mitochondrial [Cylas formicarius]
MLKFKDIFSRKCSVIGMIHVGALPGTPSYAGDINKLVSKACKEAQIYLSYNLDGILVENMHDIPYIQSHHFGPEVGVTMSRVCSELRKVVPDNVACGVQVLSCGNKEAMAIAKVCSFDFIRAEGYVFSHIGDEGFANANAGTLLRYRKQIGAQNVLVFADIKKKHSSHAITSDVSLEDTAKAAEYFLADGLVLTGTSTGVPASTHEMQSLKKCVNLPIIIGSGVTIDNVDHYLSAHALIVGSHFKEGGKWNNDIDEQRVEKFMQKLVQLNK